MAKMAKEQSDSSGSPLWHSCLERFREELEKKDDYDEIIEVDSLEELLNRSKTFRSLLPSKRTALNSINRLGPRLDDFSTIVALYSGADAKLTALVWGSVWLMLALASSGAGDTLEDVLDMLELVSVRLPRFKAYQRTFPVDGALETAILDLYTELICFYARIINFFRTHPHAPLRRSAWEGFRADFDRTVRRIERMSFTVEGASAPMSFDVKHKESLDLIESFQKSFSDLVAGLQKSEIHEREAIKSHDEAIQCHYIPYEPNPQFWGRQQVLKAIKEELDPERGSGFLKAFALYGMGGVGKTQIALQYANRNRDRYNAILWVAADSTARMGQSFRDIAHNLGLVKSDEAIKDGSDAIREVKNWLAQARCSWLLIFDNADDLEILRLTWPGNTHGSVLVTTRDFNAAHSPAAAGFHVQPFDDDTGSNLLLHLLGLDTKQAANQEKALEITRSFGGLPLALNQIGGFISQRKLPLRDFLPLYERNSAKIDSRKTVLSDYAHTLSTVWEKSLSELAGNSYKLLNLLVFFDPVSIHESVLIEGSKLLNDEDFNFIHDEIDLGDAEEVLLRSALIDKSIETAVLSVHRLVQVAVIRRLSEEDKSKYFDVVVRILGWGVQATWTDGHQYEAWRKCRRFCRHFNHLVKQAKTYKIRPQNIQLYGELILQYSWCYSQEEFYYKARILLDEALQTVQDKESFVFANATELSGLIDLEMNCPGKALISFKNALAIREELLGPADPLRPPFIAASLDKIALAYTEMAELDTAYTTQKNAIDMRLRAPSKMHRVGNSYRNMSSLLLRMGKPDEAEEMLKKCRPLEEFKAENLRNLDNSGLCSDMVLLSRIRRDQGRRDEAMDLASKALAFRRQFLNPRSKTCDSLYDVAHLLSREGKVDSAIDLLTELVTMSEKYVDGQGQLARANYKLAVLYDQKGKGEDGARCKTRALELRAELRMEIKGAAFEEVKFRELCPWMLW